VKPFLAALGLFLLRSTTAFADPGIPETIATQCKIAHTTEGRDDWEMADIHGTCYINEAFEHAGIRRPWASIFVQGVAYGEQVHTLFEDDLEVVTFPDVFGLPVWTYVDQLLGNGVLTGSVEIWPGELQNFSKQNIAVGIAMTDSPRFRYIYFSDFKPKVKDPSHRSY
jgi:hypothetical protein